MPYAAPVTSPTSGAGARDGVRAEPVAAYIVLSHRDPDQVTRLVRTIRASSPRSQVFVSHDSRSSAPPRIEDPRTHVAAHGRATDWGSFEIVQATLDALRWAQRVADPDMAVVISGQDYPTRRLESWERAFLRAGGWAGTARRLNYRPRWGRGDEAGTDRALLWYAYRWVRLPRWMSDRLPDPVRTRWYRLLHGVLKRTEPALAYHFLRRGRGPYVGVPRRHGPFSDDRPCYKGSQWLAMDRPLVDLVVADAAPGSRLYDTFQDSLIPDEAFLQTMLSWAAPVQPDSAVSYLDWGTDARAESPRVLGIGDLPAVLASGAPFCRKVDPVDATGLLDALDRVNGAASEDAPGDAADAR